MAATLTVGQKDEMTIAYLDQNGQPLATTPTPDAPPGWSNTTPATEILAIAADGNSASLDALAVGTDTINLSLVVGGHTFTAAADVTVEAAPATLTSVEIVFAAPTGP